MRVHIQLNGETTFFELNNDQATNGLYAQLLLTITVENFSNNEKIFYPPKKLDTTDASLTNAQFRTLAYYVPWRDVVMFYDKFGSANGLYELGSVISSGEYVKDILGNVKIEKHD